MIKHTTNKAIVPLSIKVMLVGAIPPEGTMSNQSYLYEYLSPDIKGISDDAIEPDFMAITKMTENDRGAYIHFSLPDALTKGVENYTNHEIEYRNVPDRWLVTRLWTDDDKTVKSKCFLLESDTLQKEKSSHLYNLRSASYPFLSDAETPYRYIGRAFPLDIKKEALPLIEETLDDLTAVAPGNPCFAAFFNDCCNVFGFFDDLKNEDGNFLKNINITYLVCGWYKNSQKDILHKIKDYDECLKYLSWKVPEETSFPADTLCHGLISDICWKDENTDYTGGIPLDLEKPGIAVGNTSLEALAAIAESKKPKGFLNERMTNMLLCGLRQKLTEPDGLVKSIDEMHKARFGNHIKVRNVDIKEKTQLHQEEYIKNKKLFEDLNNELMEIVNTINQLETQLFWYDEELESNQEQLYDLFCKYVNRYNLEDIDEADELLKMYFSKIYTYGNIIDSIREKRQCLKNELASKEKCLKDRTDGIYEIIEKNGQRFWEPNDPVLLLYGIDRNYSHGADGRFSIENNVMCRSLSQIITKLTIEPIIGLLEKGVTVVAKDLFRNDSILSDIKEYGIPDECIDIINEAILLSPGFSRISASFVADQAQISDKDKIEVLSSAIRKLQTAPVNGVIYEGLDMQQLCEAAGFDGVFPEIYSVGYWKQPWSPLYMCWELIYYPDPHVMEEVPRLDNWKLIGDDYVYNGADLPVKNYIVYRNRTVITPYAAEVAAEMLKDVIVDPEIIKAIKNMGILSQKINGFNERLLMRYLQLQTPITFRKIDKPEFKNQVAVWLEGYTFEKPEFKKFFSPIRAGYMQINQINIVDAFAQTMRINPTGAVVAEDFRYGQSNFKKSIMLPPRIIQPSRMNFNWLNKNQSPVCGWLLPNHIEKSISCYSEDGELLGFLQSVMFEGGSVVWRLPPEKGGMISDLQEDMDETLYQILNNVIEISNKNSRDSGDEIQTDLLEDLIAAIDSSLWNINPSSSQLFKGLSLLVGRPLAVVRASVKLELLGKEKQCKTMEKNIHDPGTFPYPHINKAEFRVEVGRKENHGDGVIGFYVNEDYSKLYLSAVDSDSKYDYFDNENKITLCMDEDINPVDVTFIMDSSGSIDLISGILPVKSIKLPENLIKESLNRLYLTIFSAPVLTDKFDIIMPYPKTPGKQFSWVYMNKDKKLIEVSDIQHSDGQGFFPETPFEAIEGWLKLKINDK